MKKLFSPFSPRIIRILFTLFTLIALGISSLQFNLVMIRNVMSNDQCGWRPISNQPNILLVTDVAPGGVTDQA